MNRVPSKRYHKGSFKGSIRDLYGGLDNYLYYFFDGGLYYKYSMMMRQLSGRMGDTHRDGFCGVAC